MTDPIVKTVTVPLPSDRAFTLFTRDIAEWWPLDSHSLSAQEEGQPARSVDIPAEVGGEVRETRPDGSTAPWGRVTDYTPGIRFGMTWHVGRSEAQASHVSVDFVAVADGTRVTLVHSGWQALGTEATAIRAGYVTGWDYVLHIRFARACGRMPVPA
ncbi:MAG: SRPBCC domain-containing protein [Rhodobacter sp.]|nr:SRPBCC domain-containing protein [Rhodobacter sp.]